ncbi:cytochrome P450 [Aspergillus fijiensis CBS 313.89]|uniref:Cytochrome P450 n=1 Tax=Aspergillus fijiensis CBS 313.89 TaxID=1448319 RepID=A0A8G1RYR0_9EURO|nr:cytochrome P450 [Aspergillus fijiensis CBS 313.89]RAK81177.1 cytochrome P450 [Aspergillus fijiensis CBS 313.89]
MAILEVIDQLFPSASWAIAALFLVLWKYLSFPTEIPVIETRKGREVSYAKAKERFTAGGASLIRFTEAKFKAFFIITDLGERLILSGQRYAHELRNETRLDSGLFLEKDLYTTLPGFEPFSNGRRHGRITHDIVARLTRTIPAVVQPIAEEASQSIREVWTDKKEWHAIDIQPSLARIIASVAGRIYIGEQLSRNPRWLDAILSYTGKDVLAIYVLKKWPEWTIPLVHWLLPSCRNLRRRQQELRQLLLPVIAQRREQRARQASNKEKPQLDILDFIEESAHRGEAYDPVISMIAFFFATIPTASDLLTKVIFDIVSRPDLVAELRQEVISAVESHGWSRNTIHNLKLMDSAIKETQRLQPVSSILMRRLATETFALKDGTVIPKGKIVGVTIHHMWDAELYAEPEKYDPYRFLRMKENPSQEHKAHAVATSVEHMGFGHGNAACPGRFFAVAAVKVILSHILMRYEIKSVESEMPQTLSAGISCIANPMAQLMVRRREEEIAL